MRVDLVRYIRLQTPPKAGIPYVQVVSQDIDGNHVIVDWVVSVGPGWIAIQADSGGQPGEVIGYTHVADGVNNGVIVTVDKSKLTDPVWAVLHTDNGAEHLMYTEIHPRKSAIG